MAEILIRPLKTSDIEQICKIAVRAWTGIHNGYRKYIGNNDLYDRLSNGWQEQKAVQVRNKAQEHPEEVLVSELDGKIVGFVTFALDLQNGIGEICNNAVDPEYQGKGIGSQQHLKTLDIFRGKGLKYAIVSTGYEDEGHAKARASYEKVGFKKMRASITYSLKL
ncbi:MAG: GNAT family N-acetyltransferase [Verrucomicrobiota bacterium]